MRLLSKSSFRNQNTHCSSHDGALFVCVGRSVVFDATLDLIGTLLLFDIFSEILLHVLG